MSLGVFLGLSPTESDYPDPEELLAFYREASEADDAPLLLTHGDLSSLNIMVQSDTVVVIVDWDTAGWFPKHWEYICAKYFDGSFQVF
ncbi:uncharacterized protein J7T54_008143 [Emericellopsis cladophorae]|uniref:Aminoglycoside phosphotransferase domain-containing protein n=1 Tax=Emericellopsis cladophorae TaxID=2686198 RepID=A0A9P9Y7P0_9HYPO|nr:uncharacterized protein J7T54_008143 [Emericellopsis cladophorae]KAI6785049.1 hypothetical protein J7T54_008143 [Emericellopsis cladophorae]